MLIVLVKSCILIMNGYLSVLVLLLSVVVAHSAVKPGCEKKQCPGPSRYYKEIGCQPVFKKPEDCCPQKWNCDHIRNRPKNKCHAYGTEYNVGDLLKKEDLGCRQRCACTQKNSNEPASFTCTSLSVAMSPVPPGCYRPRNATMCFPGRDVCPEKQEDIPKCEVDGKVYKAGEFFSSKDNPHLECYCGAGWKGEYVMPFCKDTTLDACGFELEHGLDVIKNCAPIWGLGKNPNHVCNENWICHEPKDQITRKKGKSTNPPAAMECKFGNLTMKLDDDINRETSNSCIKCRCDVPPVPTCMRLPKDYCTGNLSDDSSEEN